MKENLFSAIFCACFFAACTNNPNVQNVQNQLDSLDADTVKEKIVAPAVVKESEFFYDFDSTEAMKITDPIFYDVVIKNHKKDDDWEEERLAKTNIQPLANAIYQAVYKGKLQAYDYFTDAELSVNDIKELEKKFNRKEIGNIMFEEKWFFNEKTMTFTKKIVSLTFGYETFDQGEFTGFKAAFKVKLN